MKFSAPHRVRTSETGGAPAGAQRRLGRDEQRRAAMALLATWKRAAAAQITQAAISEFTRSTAMDRVEPMQTRYIRAACCRFVTALGGEPRRQAGTLKAADAALSSSPASAL